MQPAPDKSGVGLAAPGLGGEEAKIDLQRLGRNDPPGERRRRKQGREQRRPLRVVLQQVEGSEERPLRQQPRRKAQGRWSRTEGKAKRDRLPVSSRNPENRRRDAGNPESLARVPPPSTRRGAPLLRPDHRPA